MSAPSGLTVVIGSFLEEDLVMRIAAAHTDGRVIYEPDLLPVPQYPCDHTGPPRALSGRDLARWQSLGAQADVYFDFDWFEPAGMAARNPRLRWIQATSAGIGSFMQRTGLDRSGLQVTTASGIHAVPLAEFALTGVLHFVKGLPQLSKWQRAHHWERYTTRQLAGLRALVVGLGGVGRRVASSLAGLGVDVWGLGRAGSVYDVDGVSRVVNRSDLGAVLPATDIVVLACPLTDDTRGLIGAEQLDLLPLGAVVVNIARGAVVDQEALIGRLRAGRIAGACLDVFAEEPLPAASPLWDMPNVIISPHSASTVSSENVSLVDLFLDNLARWIEGRRLRNLYDPERGY
jgi:glyoxylate/hydroxypyruvate reductase A